MANLSITPTGGSSLSKASALENVTGTDNAKYLTPLANVPAFNSSMARQAIINGNFDVWQRGTTNSTISDDIVYFLADRWHDLKQDDGGTPPTLTRSRQALTTGELFNSFYVSRLAFNGAGSSFGNGSYHFYREKIENGVRNLCGDGKKVTISFWAKSDVANKKIGIWLQQVYGTGGTPSALETINGTYFTLTSTLTKYTYTFTTNTLSGKTFGTANDDFLTVGFSYQWGSDYNARNGAASAETYVGSGYVDLAQVQLCAGDVALPFQPKSYGQELADCQRYYYLHVSGASKNIGVGCYYSATQFQGSIQFPVSMRVAPVLDATSGTDYYDCERDSGVDNVNSFTIYRPTRESAMIYNNSEASGTSGHAGEMHTVSASAYIGFSAEL